MNLTDADTVTVTHLKQLSKPVPVHNTLSNLLTKSKTSITDVPDECTFLY